MPDFCLKTADLFGRSRLQGRWKLISVKFRYVPGKVLHPCIRKPRSFSFSRGHSIRPLSRARAPAPRLGVFLHPVPESKSRDSVLRFSRTRGSGFLVRPVHARIACMTDGQSTRFAWNTACDPRTYGSVLRSPAAIPAIRTHQPASD